MAERKNDAGYSEKSRGFISEEIKHHVKDKGMPQDQAVAAAMSEARRKGLKVPKEGATKKND
jgi:hypothetical protein